MELFNFEKNDITRHIEDELETFKKFKEPLNFVIKSLIKLGHSYNIESLENVDLNFVKERKGKNYFYSVFIYENITLFIRRYHHHLTIFTKVVKNRTEYGAFTFNTDFDKLEKTVDIDTISESYYEKPFLGLNEIIVNLLTLLNEKDGGVFWVWNSVSLKRPDYVDIKSVFSNKEIQSLDDFTFCMEELSCIYLELFAENIMLKKIKEYENKIGENLNKRYQIGEIITEVKNDYYHGVGITLIDTMNKNKEEFQDVYSLTRWYNEDLMKDFFIYNGEVYTIGEEFEVDKPVSYKALDGITLFKETYPKENFIPLKEYK